jgi:hypothetical protein
MIRKSPLPLFAKEGYASLWKREVRRDFKKLMIIQFEIVNNFLTSS